jgi:hypothetical protein
MLHSFVQSATKVARDLGKATGRAGLALCRDWWWGASAAERAITSPSNPSHCPGLRQVADTHPRLLSSRVNPCEPPPSRHGLKEELLGWKMSGEDTLPATEAGVTQGIGSHQEAPLQSEGCNREFMWRSKTSLLIKWGKVNGTSWPLLYVISCSSYNHLQCLKNYPPPFSWKGCLRSFPFVTQRIIYGSSVNICLTN